MASPYILTNHDLQFVNTAGQDYKFYVAFLNPLAITTSWDDINLDKDGNWTAPANYDTALHKVQPYAPTANLGSNRIGFVSEPLLFDGSRSCQRHDLPVVSYTWTVSGSPTITAYANNSQIGCVWTSPGLYTVQLTVSDQAGTATTGTRQVMIYQDRDHALPGLISVSGLSGSLNNGGWQCQITTVNSQVTLFQPDALPIGTYQPMVLMCETRYEIQPNIWADMTIGPHGQFNPGYPYQDPRILFDGYIQNGSIHQDVDKDTLSFTCVGPQMILQEVKTHLVGYYNCAYTSIVNGIPQGCKPASLGHGYMVGNLMTADVVHSILQNHCNIGNYHDIHIWNANIPTNPYTPGGANAYYNLVYSTLSVTEGTIWQNIGDLSTNEWATAHCEHDGSIRIGPQINYRGADYWQQPTLLGETTVSALINFVQDLGYTVGNTLATMPADIPQLASQPIPIRFVHPWAQQPNPPQFLRPYAGSIDPQIATTQQMLTGPPILCVFSDSPIYDSGSTAPQYVYPWTANNWPQDLAVYPLSMDITSNYTGRTSLVKLIGTLVGHSTIWSSWYPQNAFKLASDGVSSIVTTILPAGNWIVNESHVLGDITVKQNAVLLWNWWWEIARREYFAQNAYYVGSITCGMFTAATLGDIVGITRQNNTLGPKWVAKPFYVTEISYNIDLTSRSWSTSLSLGEVTSAVLDSIQPPPTAKPPKG